MTSEGSDRSGEFSAGESPRGDVREELAQRYLAALEAGSCGAAVGVVDEAIARSISTAAIHTGIIEPALRRIGELWREQALTVADEHLASEITWRVLAHLVERQAPRVPVREKVLVAGVEGERHVIGLRMAADLLEAEGFDVVFLGADVPTDALVSAVAVHAPAVTALGCTCTAPALAAAVDAFAAAGIESRLLVGGQGVPQSLREGPCTWVACAADVVEAVEGLVAAGAANGIRPPGQTDRRRPPESPRHDVRRATAAGGFRLTPRQTQVLCGLADGKSTEQIAAELVLTPVTVRNHVANILAALGVHSRLQAVVAARRRGLIE